MNEDHLRHLSVTFSYIDTLLGEADRILGTADTSPFARYILDASAAQRRAADSRISELRVVMMRIMGELGLASPVPKTSTRWAARGVVSAARNALAEIRPKVMRGYGPLSEADSKQVNAIVSALDARLEKLGALLAQEASVPS